MSVLDGYADLMASFKILRRNDKLLDYLITSLPNGYGIQDKYRMEIKNYFKAVRSMNYEDTRYNERRARKITHHLKQLWRELHGKIETSKLFENFEEFERFLFRIPRYRGHFIHQFNVFVLGFYILSRIQEDPFLKDKITEHNDQPFFTWMICSTSHDVGYSIQEIDNWFKDFLERLLGATSAYHIDIRDILTPNYPRYVEYIAEIHHQLTILRQNQWNISERQQKDMQFEELLLRKLGNKNHGIIGAIILAYSILIKETSLDRSVLISRDFPRYILPACHAIAIHSLEPEELIIEFEKLPFAFLLVLCDELQDWGRSLYNKNQSDLIEVNVFLDDIIPKISFKVKILDSSKIAKFKMLLKKLSCVSIEVTIEAEYNDQQYVYKIGNRMYE